MTKKFKIYDWAGNLMFDGISFKTFEDAWNHIYVQFPDLNDTDLDEFYVK